MKSVEKSLSGRPNYADPAKWVKLDDVYQTVTHIAMESKKKDAETHPLVSLVTFLQSFSRTQFIVIVFNSIENHRIRSKKDQKEAN